MVDPVIYNREYKCREYKCSKILKAGERNSKNREQEPNIGFEVYQNKIVDLELYHSSSLIYIS